MAISELATPTLEFGGAASGPDLKSGLVSAGPFDMRFGSARADRIAVGMIGPPDALASTRSWLERFESGIPALRGGSRLRRAFPGFSTIFRKRIIIEDTLTVTLGGEGRDVIADALAASDPFVQFRKILDLYDEGLRRLAARDANRPDIVLICVPPEVRDTIGTVSRTLSDEAKAVAKSLAVRRQSRQLDFLDLFETVEEGPDDLMARDLRNALKARALACRLPIQLVTRKLTEETPQGEDPATRAWNFSVGLYYKAGGVPWRVRPEGPPTCFVGISFHHVETAQNHVVRSSLAHAFSSDGEGFAIRGGGVPVEPGQKLALNLSGE